MYNVDIGSVTGLSIKRDWYGQGFVFKSWKNYYIGNDVDPVYVPELSDKIYNRMDFLDIAEGDKELATELFEAVDWQHPETLLEDWMVNGEIGRCKKCHKLVFVDWNDKCLECGGIVK